MNRSLLILTAVLGCAALHLACSRSEPVAHESDPERLPRLDEMSPEDRSIILGLHELAARQAAAGDPGPDLEVFLAHEHAALSPLVFELSGLDPLLTVPPRQLDPGDVELAAALDDCPKHANGLRAVRWLEEMAAEARARGLRYDRTDPVTASILADDVAGLEPAALEAAIEGATAEVRRYLAEARPGQRIELDRLTGTLLLHALATVSEPAEGGGDVPAAK
jgi:hypothetical protein